MESPKLRWGCLSANVINVQTLWGARAKRDSFNITPIWTSNFHDQPYGGTRSKLSRCHIIFDSIKVPPVHGKLQRLNCVISLLSALTSGRRGWFLSARAKKIVYSAVLFMSLYLQCLNLFWAAVPTNNVINGTLAQCIVYNIGQSFVYFIENYVINLKQNKQMLHFRPLPASYCNKAKNNKVANRLF